MAVETLKIVLTADNKQAIAGMNETVNSLNKVSAAGAATGGAVTKMGTNFTGLSRVIQDLPYGFNAISNNLTQLLPAAGAAGLAFSGIVTALTFAQIGFGAWTRGMGGATKATEDAAKANEEYLSSLAKEKVNLDTLFTTATNANVPLKARLDAVKQLRDNYGGYLKDFSDESIMAGKATTAYNELTNAIVKSARARAAQNLLVTKQEELLKLEQEAIKSKETAEKELANASWKGKADAAQMSGLQYANADLQIAGRRADAYNKLNSALSANGAKVAEITKEMQLLQSQIQQNTINPLKQSTEGKGGGKTKEITIKDENKALEEQIQIYKRLQQGMMGQGFITQEKAKEKDLTNLKLTMQGNAALNEITATQLNLKDQMNARTELANQLTDRAMQGITGIANAMANGGNIGQAFGDMFKQLAIDIALAAAKAAIFQAILSAINPVGGASKAGGFLKGFGKLLGFAEGGTVSGPSSGYPVMLHGTEHIVRPDQMKSIIASASQMGGSGASRVVVEGRIQGQDIWLSQQRTNTFRGLST
jgi:hypothetical protein